MQMPCTCKKWYCMLKKSFNVVSCKKNGSRLLGRTVRSQTLCWHIFLGYSVCLRSLVQICIVSRYIKVIRLCGHAVVFFFSYRAILDVRPFGGWLRFCPHSNFLAFGAHSLTHTHSLSHTQLHTSRGQVHITSSHIKPYLSSGRFKFRG